MNPDIPHAEIMTMVTHLAEAPGLLCKGTKVRPPKGLPPKSTKSKGLPTFPIKEIHKKGTPTKIICQQRPPAMGLSTWYFHIAFQLPLKKPLMIPERDGGSCHHW